MSCEIDGHELPIWDYSQQGTCVIDFCKNLMDTARKESCGQCVLCREGTWQVYEIIKEITEGNGRNDDFELLVEILTQIEINGKCEMSKSSASQCIKLMEKYEEEWDNHIRRKRCKNLVCKGTYTFYIDPKICDGCGECIERCTSGAIAGSVGMIHIINPSLCNKTMVCAAVCSKGAIKKAGPIKPKVPSEPVPAGSFGQSEEEEGGNTIRRRRRKG